MQVFTRSSDASGPAEPMVPLHQLTTKQRQIVEFVDRYQTATEEPCPALLIARRLHVHHSTIQEQLVRLHRLGWMRGPNAPACLTRRLSD